LEDGYQTQWLTAFGKDRGLFTGHGRVDPIVSGRRPARVSGGTVTFDPGARSAVHTHSTRPTLIVTSGLAGQCEGGPIEKSVPGYVIWFARREHWHGATATTAMSIRDYGIANGKMSDWMEGQRRQYRADRGTASPLSIRRNITGI